MNCKYLLSGVALLLVLIGTSVGIDLYVDASLSRWIISGLVASSIFTYGAYGVVVHITPIKSAHVRVRVVAGFVGPIAFILFYTAFMYFADKTGTFGNSTSMIMVGAPVTWLLLHLWISTYFDIDTDSSKRIIACGLYSTLVLMGLLGFAAFFPDLGSFAMIWAISGWVMYMIYLVIRMDISGKDISGKEQGKLLNSGPYFSAVISFFIPLVLFLPAYHIPAFIAIVAVYLGSLVVMFCGRMEENYP